MAETILQRIEKIANSYSSSEEDAKFISHTLHLLGLKQAVVVGGIVYMEGRGTLDSPPSSIHSVARIILRLIKEKMK